MISCSKLEYEGVFSLREWKMGLGRFWSTRSSPQTHLPRKDKLDWMKLSRKLPLTAVCKSTWNKVQFTYSVQVGQRFHRRGTLGKDM
jgi:hypothetical protein